MKPVLLRVAVVAASLGWLVAPAAAQQPCNPVIDGTYCATQGGSLSDTPYPGARRRGPNVISGFGDAFSGVSDHQPVTFGAITFSADTKCIGLMRRGSCNAKN